MPTVIESIATGTPDLRRSQEEAAAFMQRVEGIPDPIRSRIPAIYRSSAIDYRHSCVADYGRADASEFTFFPPTWTLEPAPTTAQRNQKYREAAVPLAEDVARRALEASDSEATDITHVVAVSCTGFFAPGLDIELVKRLDLPMDTRRTMIGFMGCYAAFNALRVAHSFCQANPEARVLLVCAELCTLHFQVDDTLESAIVNSLFADGAAAAVLSARTERGAAGRWTYAGGHSRLDDDSMGAMTWDIGNTGFQMGLAASVPQVIADALPGYLDQLLGPHDLTADALDFWAIHPGGRAIVEKAQDVLGLADSDVAPSLDVLRRYGNMSSPTILFVLKRILEQDAAGDGAPSTHGAAMAFGPGLTIEGALFRRG